MILPFFVVWPMFFWSVGWAKYQFQTRSRGFSGFFSKLPQSVFAFFLHPEPPLKIIFVAPHFSLLCYPFFHSHSFLSPQILHHRKMVKPNGAKTELNQLWARQLLTASACIETFVHATFVDVAFPMMFRAGASPTGTIAAVAALVLQIVNASSTI